MLNNTRSIKSVQLHSTEQNAEETMKMKTDRSVTSPSALNGSERTFTIIQPLKSSTGDSKARSVAGLSMQRNSTSNTSRTSKMTPSLTHTMHSRCRTPDTTSIGTMTRAATRSGAWAEEEHSPTRSPSTTSTFMSSTPSSP